MTSPIAFTPTNRPIGTDAADMPHVLGDPADALWQGTAERTNANFDLMRTWATAKIAAMNAMRIPAADLTGTGVIVGATNWTVTSAYARTLQMLGTAKFVEMYCYMTYTGTTYWNGNMHDVTLGTLVAALRPTLSKFFVRGNGVLNFNDPLAAPDGYDSYYGCDIEILTTGAVIMRRPSTVSHTFSKNGYFLFHHTYFTGI